MPRDVCGLTGTGVTLSGGTSRVEAAEPGSPLIWRTTMKRLLTAVLLLLPTTVNGQTVTLPATANGAPGVPVPVTAQADGKNVVWVTPDSGLVVIDGSFFGGDSKKALVFGPQGTYRLWAFTAKGDVVSPKAECVVTFGTPTPPVPPGPVDPFGRAVLTAYLADTSTTKAADAVAWAAAFDSVTSQVDGLSTYADLDNALKTALATTRPGAIPGVAAVVVKELQSAFTSTGTTALDKVAVKAELVKISTALKSLKGGK